MNNNLFGCFFTVRAPAAFGFPSDSCYRFFTPHFLSHIFSGLHRCGYGGFVHPVRRNASFFFRPSVNGGRWAGHPVNNSIRGAVSGALNTQYQDHLSVLLLMAIFAQALLAFVRRNLMSLSLFSTRHMQSLLK
ncbi:MAG: hypothetical protein H6559_08790 [Lewinellaceae bacterium]|nr:hypothetical protein [Lewinellaceae bacterium]